MSDVTQLCIVLLLAASVCLFSTGHWIGGSVLLFVMGLKAHGVKL